jgi:hypothetical protein
MTDSVSQGLIAHKFRWQKPDKFLISYDGHIARIQVFIHQPVLYRQQEDLNGSPSKVQGSISIQIISIML